MRLRVLVEGIDTGGGFAVTPRVVLTALHVVAGAPAEQLAVRLVRGDVTVSSVREFPELDIAALEVDADLEAVTTCEPHDGDPWKVAAPPQTDLPYLSGVVTTASRDWLSSEGFSIPAIQLGVNEDIKDFHGYSGSPVYLPEEGDAVVGVLVEQQPVLDARPGEPSSAANVLYAVPVEAVLRAAGLGGTPRHVRSGLRPPACIVYHDGVVAALRGYRSRLTSRSLAFVEPREQLPWGPGELWSTLKDPSSAGLTLLTGHGGVGKTRTMLEVARLASADGWQVLHVRGGNASRVADYLNDRISTGRTSPVLLVIDYLNIARELDLLSLTELVGQSRAPEPRLSILASSRTGWERKYRHYPGLDRLSRVALERTPADTADVCRAIVRQVAPRASATAGVDEVLRITGATRPILAVLLGQIVEAQFLAAGSFPAALVSEDLAVWLEGRLREDELLPQTDHDRHEVTPQLLGAAASLAGSPASQDDVIDTAAFAIDESGYPERATHIVHKLQQIGWLQPSEHGLEAAHDVVADKVLEGVLFYDDDRGVRRQVLRRLLDLAFVSSTAFANIVDSVERVLNERDARSEESTALLSGAQAWLDERSSDLVRKAPAQAHDRGRISIRLLRSELFALEEGGYWRTLAHPLLESITGSAAGEPLLSACLLMPRHAEPRIVDLALNWLAERPSVADDQLITAVLARKDLEARQATRAIDISLAWLHEQTDLRLADFVLARLLGRPELQGPGLEATTRHLLDWIGRFEDSWGVPRLLKVALERPDLDQQARHQLERVARTWLRAHPTEPVSTYLLQWNCASAAGDPSEEETAWRAARRWLDANPTRPDTSHLLETLLAWSGLTDVRAAALWPAVSVWLEANSTRPDASFMLQALLTWPGLTEVRAEATWAAAATWLAANPGLPDTNHVIQDLLGWSSLTEDQAETTWAAASAWLEKNPVVPEANFLFQALLNWPGLIGTRAEATWAATSAWLENNPRLPDTSFLLQALLRWPELTTDRAEPTWAAIATWLKDNPTHPGASHLLEALLAWPGLTGTRAEATWDATSAWLAANPGLPDTNHVIQGLLGWSSLTEDQAEATWAAASAWLETNPGVPVANFLLQALLTWPGLTGTRAEATWAATSAWLEANPGLPDTNFLLQALLRWPELTTDRAEPTWAAIATWLKDNPTHPGASHLLEALLAWPGLTGTRAEATWDAAAAWLEVEPTRADSRHLLEALVAWPGLTGRPAEEFWVAAVVWLEADPTLPEASFLLRALFAWPGLTEERAETTWATAAAWMEANPTRAEVNFLVQALLKWPGLTDERAVTTWATAVVWLAANPTRPEVNFLLQAMLAWPGLTETRAEEFWSAATAWLDADPNGLASKYLLEALLVWPGLTETRTEEFWAATTKWLDANQTRPETKYLLEALLAWPGLTESRTEKIWAATTKWLDANPTRLETKHLLERLLVWPGLTGRRVDTTWAATAAWLDANPTRFEAKFLLERLLVWPGLTESRAETAWAATTRWLDASPTRLPTKYLLEALLVWPGLTGQRVDTTWAATTRWLDVNSTRPETKYLLEALLVWPGLTEARAETFWVAATRWLDANSTQPRAKYLVRALLAWPRLTEPRAQELRSRLDRLGES